MRRAIEVLLIASSLTGCTEAIMQRSLNRYVATDYTCGIDESVLDETEKLLPNGWVTKPYSPVYWQQYWNSRIFYLAQYNFDKERSAGYDGPVGRTFILYALRQRQEAGLPDVVPEQRNTSTVAALYSELQNSPRSSCAILGRPSPVCILSPAQHHGTLKDNTYQRQCTVAH